MDRFSPTELGKKLRVIRENKGLTLEIAESVTGVEMHTISRIERGAIEKPSFQQLVDMGKGYDITPNEIAALADLYVIEKNEQEMLGDNVWRQLNDIRNYLYDVTDEERRGLLTLIGLIVDTHKRQKDAKIRPTGEDILPDWFRAS